MSDDIAAAAEHLCDYCLQRMHGFLGAHRRNPHIEDAAILRMIRDLAGQCCSDRLPPYTRKDTP